MWYVGMHNCNTNTSMFVINEELNGNRIIVVYSAPNKTAIIVHNWVELYDCSHDYDGKIRAPQNERLDQRSAFSAPLPTAMC